jgi:hypothetical protein
MEISKFMNGDKEAVVMRGYDIMREQYIYTVHYYLDKKVLRKESVSVYEEAAVLAEKYIFEGKDSGPTLLMENV